MTARRASAIAAVLLLGMIGLLQYGSRADAQPSRTTFASFPLQLGEPEHGAGHWRGREIGLEPEILDVLRVDDYVMRVYVPEDPSLVTRHASLVSDQDQGQRQKVKGRREERTGTDPTDKTGFTGITPVWLYIGYYGSQRTGATYHSPLNCLPGSGWSIMSRQETTVELPARAHALRVNRVLIQKGLDRQLVLYWYQDRGRVITSEYWAKAHLLWDAVTRNRTDGALVRVSVPVASSTAPELAVEEADRVARRFLEGIVPLLPNYLPE